MTKPPPTLDGHVAVVSRRSPFLVVGRLVLASALSLAVLGGCMFFDEVDRCLDRGGRWNDATETCVFDEQSGAGASVDDVKSTSYVSR